MDEILKTLYVKLDSTMQSLSKAAMSQILIKIVYSSSGPISEADIINRYKVVIAIKTADIKQIKSLLNDLVAANELKYNKGRYYLSQSKKEKIDKAQAESTDREIEIIDKFFKSTHSDIAVIQEWFRDAMMSFFNVFSDEWVSSLCYKNNSIVARIDSILITIKKRTANNKLLDKSDINVLPDLFKDFILSTDPMVNAILWEYGTSSFSAKLIKISSEVDKFTIEVFNGSRCILDTNILMHIGLESSIYYESICTLESVFVNLGIEVGILNISKEEYKRTVANKCREIMSLIQKNSSNMIELFKQIDDQYIKTALSRCCTCQEDFELFFDQLMDPPKLVNNKLEIHLYDDDIELDKAIESAQNDNKKREELNKIYFGYRQKDKLENALVHDVGLIYGAKYLRDNGKYFILSQDSSVNAYARQKPFIQNLPMSMSIETLLNVLALNNTNYSSDNYVSLYANLIRQGLQPNKDTFKLEDLSFIIEKNEQIAQLPPEHSRKIVESVHKKRLLGENEEKIILEMNRLLQHEKMEVFDELNKTKDRLYISGRENDNLKYSNDKLSSVLEKEWNSEANKKFEKEHRGMRNRSFIKLLFGFALIFVLLIIILHKLNAGSFFVQYIIPIILDLILSAIYGCLKMVPNIQKHKNDKEKIISEYVAEKKKEYKI